MNKVYHSDNIELIKTLADNSVDAVITDSPYGLGKEPNPTKLINDWITKGYHEIKGTGFMGREWDAFVPQPVLWKECYRVLKPGGHLLSFFGTRTYDWGTLAIRLAGFEIRDCIQWIYGNGFPKSKTHLKPANEPICVARKPGGSNTINIDDCRIEFKDETDMNLAASERPNAKNHNINRTKYNKVSDKIQYKTNRGNVNGRWPSNVILDEQAADILDNQTGNINQSVRKQWSLSLVDDTYFKGKKQIPKYSYNDFGGASRFFYVAKASPSERAGSKHPTIKPIKLMDQLVKLYCPKGGLVLDPHMGSGTTIISCIRNGRNWIGIDNDISSFNDTTNRIQKELGIFLTE